MSDLFPATVTASADSTGYAALGELRRFNSGAVVPNYCADRSRLPVSDYADISAIYTGCNFAPPSSTVQTLTLPITHTSTLYTWAKAYCSVDGMCIVAMQASAAQQPLIAYSIDGGASFVDLPLVSLGTSVWMNATGVVIRNNNMIELYYFYANTLYKLAINVGTNTFTNTVQHVLQSSPTWIDSPMRMRFINNKLMIAQTVSTAPACKIYTAEYPFSAFSQSASTFNYEPSSSSYPAVCDFAINVDTDDYLFIIKNCNAKTARFYKSTDLINWTLFHTENNVSVSPYVNSDSGYATAAALGIWDLQSKVFYKINNDNVVSSTAANIGSKTAGYNKNLLSCDNPLYLAHAISPFAACRNATAFVEYASYNTLTKYTVANDYAQYLQYNAPTINDQMRIL